MQDKLLDQLHAHFRPQAVRGSAGLTRLEDLMTLAGRSPLDARGYVRALVSELLAHGQEKLLPEFFRDGFLSPNGGTVDLVAKLTRKCIEGKLTQFAFAAAQGLQGPTGQEIMAIISREDSGFMDRLRKASQAQALARQAQQQSYQGYHGPIIVGPHSTVPTP